MPASLTHPKKGSASLLYVGIDIGKFSHAAAFLSPVLLSQYRRRYEDCPTLTFDQSRAGFERLFSVMTTYAPEKECRVLLENTGHYGRALEQFLQEKGVVVYRVHVQERERGQSKSDKRDAQSLAVLLYNQVEQQVLVADQSQIVRRLVPPSDTARLLRGLVQHRYELVRETVRRKNKLFQSQAGSQSIGNRPNCMTQPNTGYAGNETMSPPHAT
jgi:transposase